MRHYTFFGAEREGIRNPAFLKTPTFAGAQLRYSWRELEPEPDAYDFHALRDDLSFLTAKGKRLFVQFQDVTFSPEYKGVPKYLLDQFHKSFCKRVSGPPSRASA